MKKTIIALSILLGGLSQNLQAEALKMNEPSTEKIVGKVVEAYINLNSFTELRTDVVASIKVVQSSRSRIEAQGPERIISVIDASVKEGVLHVTASKDLRMKNGEKLSLTIYTPMLSRIYQDGVGSIRCEGSFKTQEMEIINNGVGGVKMEDLQCQLLTVSSNGVGGIDLKGSTEKAVYQSDGVGSIDAYDMISKVTEVRLDGVGSVHCHASERIDARNCGVGSIRYEGNPEQVNVHCDGVGNIRRR